MIPRACDVERETPAEALGIHRERCADDRPEAWPGDDRERVGHDGRAPLLRREEIGQPAANGGDRG